MAGKRRRVLLKFIYADTHHKGERKRDIKYTRTRKAITSYTAVNKRTNIHIHININFVVSTIIFCLKKL